jgi:formylglycine-generating enzyme
VLIHVDTDATLPPAPGEPAGPSDAAPLFDRLRVEIFAPGESVPCPSCARDFSIDRRTMREGRASFGFVPRPITTGYRARIRLYRSGGVAGPRPTSTVEHVIALPSVSEGTIADLQVVMLVDELGSPRGSIDAPEDAQTGAPAPGTSRVDSWPGAQRTECPEAPAEGEVCAPGGAFWMGALLQESIEALVRIDPFFVDATEVTVSAMRASKLATATDPSTEKLRVCRFSLSSNPWDQNPVNCVSKTLAESFCEAQGKTLPSAAEFEYLATRLRGDTYVWGMDQPSCADAVYARQGKEVPDKPYYDLEVATRACQSLGIGPDNVRVGERDRLDLPTGTVYGLAGNVTEWVLDEGFDCLGPGVQMNPVCRDASTDQLQVRGGAWGDIGLELKGAGRKAIARSDPPQNNLGFRCVRH